MSAYRDTDIRSGCSKSAEDYEGDRMSRDENESLLAAAKEILRVWDILPFCKDDQSGSSVCLETKLWRSFNYGEIEGLRQSVASCLRKLGQAQTSN